MFQQKKTSLAHHGVKGMHWGIHNNRYKRTGVIQPSMYGLEKNIKTGSYYTTNKSLTVRELLDKQLESDFRSVGRESRATYARVKQLENMGEDWLKKNKDTYFDAVYDDETIDKAFATIKKFRNYYDDYDTDKYY